MRIYIHIPHTTECAKTQFFATFVRRDRENLPWQVSRQLQTADSHAVGPSRRVVENKVKSRSTTENERVEREHISILRFPGQSTYDAKYLRADAGTRFNNNALLTTARQ